MMTDRMMKSAIKKYNGLMEMLALEHNTIGTDYSESTEKWNLRDMVSECAYQLSCYYEDGCCACEMRYGDADERKAWRNETGKLKRFIDKYKVEIKGLKCFTGHCSEFDN